MNASVQTPPAGAAASGFERAPSPGPAPQALAGPPLAEARLPNGLRLLLAERRGLPLLSLRLQLDALGSWRDPPGQAGLGEWLLAALVQGATLRTEAGPERSDAAELVWAAERLGGALDRSQGLLNAQLGLTLPSSVADEGLALLADLVQRPLLGAAELQTAREELLDGHARQLAEAPALARLLARRLFWGADGPGQLPDAAGLARLRRDDLLALRRRALQPAACTLLLAGDLGLDEALRLAGDHFGDWQPAAGMAAPSGPLQRAGAGVAPTWVLDSPGLSQASLLMALPEAGLAGLDPAALLAPALLVQGQGARLTRSLRGQRSLSYGIGAELQRLPEAGWLLLEAQTRAAQGLELAQLMQAELQRLLDQPPQADELEARRQAWLGAQELRLETTAGLAGWLAEASALPEGPAQLRRLGQALQALAPQPLQDLLQAHCRRYWQPERMRTVLVLDLAAAGGAQRLAQLLPGARLLARRGLDLRRLDPRPL